MPKFKYLIVKEKPFNSGEMVACVDVSCLKKKEVAAKWGELEKRFNPNQYAGCLTTCNHRIEEFLKIKPL